MSRFGNLVPIPPVGSGFMVPSGLSGLTIPPQGQSFGSGGLESLVSTQYGQGDGGGEVSGRRLMTENNDEDYISHHISISRRADNSHMGINFKSALGWVQRDQPTGGDLGTYTLVPHFFINLFLQKKGTEGRVQFEHLAHTIVEKYPSLFPSLSKYVDLVSKQIETNLESTSESLVLGGSFLGFNEIITPSGTMMRDGEVMGERQPSLFERQVKSKDSEIKTAFVKFMRENLPNETFWFNKNVGPSWLSTSYPNAKTEKKIPFDVLLETELKTKNRGDVLGIEFTENLDHHNERSPAYQALASKLDAKVELERITSTSKDGGYGGYTVSNYSSSVILNQSSREKYNEAVLNHRLVLRQATTEVLNEFKKSINAPKDAQFSPNPPSSLQYMLNGCYFENWAFVGVINTVSDNSSTYHSFGIQYPPYLQAKLVPHRLQEVYNIWGGYILQNTKAYLIHRRKPLFESTSMATNIYNSIRATFHSAADVDEFTPDELAEAAWKKYGDYELVPALGGLRGLERSKYPYVTITGRIAYGHPILIGTVVADDAMPGDVMQPNYPGEMQRDVALGISHNNEVPISVENAKKALISLPRLLLNVQQ